VASDVAFAILAIASSFIAEGRGSNPSDGGGVAIIVAVAACVALAGAAGMWLVVRRRGRG
jgi:hypothetical protein